MKNKQSNWQLKLMQFMRGRYGRIDLFSKHLMIVSILIMVGNIFIKSQILSLLTLVGLAISYYRLFSKKIYVRSNENQRYTAWWFKISQPLKRKSSQFKNRKAYRYFTCKSCKQQIRVPKNRGKIMITCPKCQHKFEKKT